MTDDIRDIGTKFEGRKIGMRHTKDGHVFYIACHENDTPHDLMQDPLGQRYTFVAVRMGDEDQPVPSRSHQEGEKAVKIAGALCGDVRFQEWLFSRGEIDEISEELATVYMREYLRVTSRRELKINAEARNRLNVLREKFVEALRRGM